MAFKDIIIKILRQDAPVLFQIFFYNRSDVCDNWNMPYFAALTMYNQSFGIAKRDVTSSDGNKFTYSYSRCMYVTVELCTRFSVEKCTTLAGSKCSSICLLILN
jgi:hypothetical protein